jgi:ribose transport system substrate-binding protein
MPTYRRALMLFGSAVAALSIAACATSTSPSATTANSAGGSTTSTASLSVTQAQEMVAKHSARQTSWSGPTTGPRAATHARIAYVSADQSYTSFVSWGNGIAAAAKDLGWDFTILDGKGTVTGQLNAMQQAVALHPEGIITSADATALQVPIQQAVAQKIPVVGIHATGLPGPSPKLGLATNISSDPVEIGRLQAAYVLAASDGKARALHWLDNSFAIARLKAVNAEGPVKQCPACKFLEEQNIPIGDQAQRIPTLVTSDLARFGKQFYITTCCDNFFTQAVSSLRSAGVDPHSVVLIGADGPPEAYDRIRQGNYEAATVPEPSTLFGYQAVDAIVRVMAGQPVSSFIQPTYLVTRDNVDAEGGAAGQFVPSNGFACHYRNIWLARSESC